MKHLFIPYELAVLAKEKGFNEPCIIRFSFDESRPDECLPNDKVARPLYQQIVDWLRIKHHIIITPDVDVIGNTYCHIKSPSDKVGFWTNNQDEPLEYYAALRKAIEKAFKLIG